MEHGKRLVLKLELEKRERRGEERVNMSVFGKIVNREFRLFGLRMGFM